MYIFRYLRFFIVESKHSGLEGCRPVGRVLTCGKLMPDHRGKGKEELLLKKEKKLEKFCRCVYETMPVASLERQ